MQHGPSAARPRRTSNTLHTDTHHTPQSRTDLIKAMRRTMPLCAIANALGISVGAVTWSIYGNRPRIYDTARSVVRRVPILGWQGSRSCYDVAVSLPRVSILEAA